MVHLYVVFLLPVKRLLMGSRRIDMISYWDRGLFQIVDSKVLTLIVNWLTSIISSNNKTA